MKQILHRYITGEIAEQGYTVIGTIVGSGITQRTHGFGIIDKTVETFYTAAGLANVRDHLTTGGTFALWSDDPASEDFTEHLRQIFGASAAHNVEFPNPYTGSTSINSVYVAQKIGG